MNGSEYFSTLARYNRWMNARIYAVCADLSDEERKRDLGAFFRSVHGTLNHVLWGDRAWMGRFENRPCELPELGTDIYGDFSELAAARVEMDDRIADWAAKLTPAWLEAPYEFRSRVDGHTRTHPTWLFVAHMFNHQTHHRGQVTTLLKQLGHEPGVTDLPWMPERVCPAS